MNDKQPTSIPKLRYQELFGSLMRDEIQLILPNDERDLFGEELRLLIQNHFVNQNNQKLVIKVLDKMANSLAEIELVGERLALICANKLFFAIYSNKQLLHVFSTNTIEIIKRGLLIEGACLIEQNMNLC